MPDKPDITSTWRKLFSFKSKTQENSTVKSVLIVDDEKPFLLSMSDGLKAYAEEFQVLTASNGKEAINILSSNRIDLMVTDLKMPKMNGFELLAWMSKNHLDIPVIVMTAFGTPEIEDKLRNMGTFRYLEKPLDINILVTSISTALNDDSANGYSRGISLASFLHLIEMEKMTCTIKVKSDRETGYLYFDNGEIMDSAVGKLKGKGAVLDILNWNNAEIDINFTCEVKENNIDSNIRELLAEVSEFEEAKQKAEEETKATAEEEKGKGKGKPRNEEETWLKAADETIMATEEEDAKVRAEKDSWLKEEKEARLKAEEEAKLKAEEKARLKTEEEARLKAEEEAKLKAEEEAKLKAEEEAKLKAEEKARLKAEEEARLKAEEEARLKAEEEARLKAEEEAKLKAEEEARLKAEEEARLKAEEEAKLKAEEEAKLKAEEEAKLKAEEEDRLKTEARKITKQRIKAWRKA